MHYSKLCLSNFIADMIWWELKCRTINDKLTGVTMVKFTDYVLPCAMIKPYCYICKQLLHHG